LSLVDHTLHVVAYVALRKLPLRSAHRLVLQASSLVPARTPSHAPRLRGGTCLSRALAISARIPRSDVVIGVSTPGAFNAHAWVEIDGKPVAGTVPHGTEIARFHGDR
jgi:hypothetical protein